MHWLHYARMQQFPPNLLHYMRLVGGSLILAEPCLLQFDSWMDTHLLCICSCILCSHVWMVPHWFLFLFSFAWLVCTGLAVEVLYSPSLSLSKSYTYIPCRWREEHRTRECAPECTKYIIYKADVSSVISAAWRHIHPAHTLPTRDH